MQLEDLGAVKVSQYGPFTTVAAAVAQANVSVENNPFGQGFVCVPGNYSGTDYLAVQTAASGAAGSVSNPAVLDLRAAAPRVAPLAAVSATGLVAAITTANFLSTAPPAGLYRVNYYLEVTTAFTTSGPNLTIGWTDIAGHAQTSATSQLAVTQFGFQQGSVVLWSNGTAQITYAMAASGGAFGAAAIALTLERLF